jgi:ribosome-binding protein aMBF1 (putative translation factor)
MSEKRQTKRNGRAENNSRSANVTHRPTHSPVITTGIPRSSGRGQYRSAPAQPAPGGSARRRKIREYRWLRRKLKHEAVLYIKKALQKRGMSRTELAENVGLSVSRINELLAVRGGYCEFERVPLDLIYQIWNATNVPPTFLSKRIIPPAHLRKGAPTT